jgi:hypothetical protein
MDTILEYNRAVEMPPTDKHKNTVEDRGPWLFPHLTKSLSLDDDLLEKEHEGNAEKC